MRATRTLPRGRSVTCWLTTVRVMMAIGLALTLIPALDHANRAAAQTTGIEGNTYTNVLGNYSVQWDPNVWFAEEVNQGNLIGLSLSTFDASVFGQVFHLTDPNTADASACLESWIEISTQGTSGVTEARGYAAPATARDAESALYIDSMTGFMYYWECRQTTPETFVLVSFSVAIQAYNNAVPILSDLLAGIQTENFEDTPNPDPGNDPSDGPGNGNETGIDGNVYTNAEFGFTVTWDDQDWMIQELDGNTGAAGLHIQGEVAVGQVLAVPSDPDECVEQFVAGWENQQGVEDFGTARGYDLPATSPDAEVALVSFTFQNDQEQSDVILYIECRPAAESRNSVGVVLSTPEQMYDDQVEVISDLLDGIEVGTAASEPAPEPGSVPETGDGSYTNEDFGFSVVWDEEIWTGGEVDEADYAGVVLASDQASFFIYAYTDFQDTNDCLDGLIAAEEDVEGVDHLEPSRSFDLPATARDAEAALYQEEYTNADGETSDALVYFECREVEGGPLGITMITDPTSYEEILPDVEDILAGIETGGSAPDPEPAPDPRPDGETGIDGNIYTNIEVGFTVEWDERIWESDEVDDPAGAGVSLTANDNVFIDIIAYDDGIEDPQECIDERVTALEDALGLGDFDRARSLDLPETARGAEAEIYTVDAEGQAGTVTFAIYVECREVDGGTLSIGAALPEEDYDATLPDLEDVLAGIEVD